MLLVKILLFILFSIYCKHLRSQTLIHVAYVSTLMKKTFILIFVTPFRSCYSLINAEFIRALEERIIVNTHLALLKAQCVHCSVKERIQ